MSTILRPIVRQNSFTEGPASGSWSQFFFRWGQLEYYEHSQYFGNMYCEKYVLRILSVSRCSVYFTLSAKKRAFCGNIFCMSCSIFLSQSQIVTSQPSTLFHFFYLRWCRKYWIDRRESPVQDQYPLSCLHSLFYQVHFIVINGVCVLHNKPFFLPVDIQTTCARAYSSTLEDIQVMWSQSYPTAVILRCHVSVSPAVGNAVPCHHTRYDRHDIHNLWKRETKGNNQSKRKLRQKNKSKEKKKIWSKKWKETICRGPPRRRGGQHLKETELEKRRKQQKHHFL